MHSFPKKPEYPLNIFSFEQQIKQQMSMCFIKYSYQDQLNITQPDFQK